MQRNADSVSQKYSGQGYEVMIIHDRCGNSNEDYYLADCILVLLGQGYRVTICSTQIEESSVLNYSKRNLQNLTQHLICKIIPDSIFGRLQPICQKIQVLTYTILSIGKAKPHFILTDSDPFCLLIIKCLRKCNTIFLPDIYKVLISKRINNRIVYKIPWFSTKFIKYADEVIVPTPELQKYYQSIFPDVKSRTTVVLPCYQDKGTRNIKPFILRNFVQKLPLRYYLFVAIVDFNINSNIIMLLKAINCINQFYEVNLAASIHLVVTSSKDQKSSSSAYFDQLVEFTRSRLFERNVSFIWESTIFEQMSLITYCTAVLHPSMQGEYPAPILMTMALGKPIVAIKTPETQKLIQSGTSGILLKNVARNFASIMHLMCRNPVKCISMGFKAQVEYRKRFGFYPFAFKICNVMSKHH